MNFEALKKFRFFFFVLFHLLPEVLSIEIFISDKNYISNFNFFFFININIKNNIIWLVRIIFLNKIDLCVKESFFNKMVLNYFSGSVKKIWSYLRSDRKVYLFIQILMYLIFLIHYNLTDEILGLS